MTNLSPPAGSSLPQAQHDDDSAPLQQHNSDADSNSAPGTHILSQQDSHPQEQFNSPSLVHSDAEPDHQSDVQPDVQPDEHSHPHSHSHTHDRRLRHTHGRNHQRLSRRQAPADSQPDSDTDVTAADPPAPSLVTQVIQTVSLIQVVDGSGSPLETRTLYAPPATVLFDPVSGVTVAISAQDEPATSAAPAADPAPSDDAPPESTATDLNQTTALTTGSASQSLSPPPSLSLSQPELSLSAASASEATALPSAPLSNASVYPPTGGNHNATNTHSNGNSNNGNSSMTADLLSQGSTTKKTSHSTLTTLSFTSLDSTTTTLSTSLSDTIFSTISSDFPSSTDISPSEGRFGGGDNTQPEPTAQADSSDPKADDLSPQEKKIVGGVVGGVAGAAFLLVLLLLALRYKRKKDGGSGLGLGQGGAASRGLTGGPGGSGGDGSGGDMAERSAPFGLTAALAGLAGKRNAPASIADAPEGERGFYRVSGRKLPSVLQAGGDGYTDPTDNRQSTMSGTSDYYRGSQAFEPISGGSTRLALGSPMRPVSGVVVMRSGPARTAVTENPFADPFDDPPPSPPPVLDPVGRTLAGQDGSRGSGSRFQEEI